MNDDFYIKYLNEFINPSEHYVSKVIDGHIIPPGLIGVFNDIIAHCVVAQKQHIMIVGDTGVGKTTFSDIFEKFYENDCESNGTNPIW